MKKTYMQPALETHTLAVENMLAGSDPASASASTDSTDPISSGHLEAAEREINELIDGIW